MNCYRYDPNASPRIVKCEDMGHTLLVPGVMPDRQPPWKRERMTSCERRMAARVGSGRHRHHARRVSPWRPIAARAAMSTHVCMVGHLLAQSTGYTVKVYLPSDVALTQRIIDDVDRADDETWARARKVSP